MKSKILLLVTSLAVLGVFGIATAQTPGPEREEIILTTYYPAPYGDYVDLNVSGNLNVSGEANFSKFNVSPTLTAEADNDVLTAVRINPTFNDDIFSGVQHNGLIVEDGNVGIGTTNPVGKLEVSLFAPEEPQAASLYIDAWGHGIVNRVSGLHNGNSGTFDIFWYDHGDGPVPAAWPGHNYYRWDLSYRASHTTSGGVTGQHELALMKGSADGGSGLGVMTWWPDGRVTGQYVNHGPSDMRLKKDVVTIPQALDKVMALRGVNFRWNDPIHKDYSLQMGMIAQEVEEVVPEVVRTADDEIKTKSIDFKLLVALLVEAIKEQQKEIDNLEGEITELKAKL